MGYLNTGLETLVEEMARTNQWVTYARLPEHDVPEYLEDVFFNGLVAGRTGYTAAGLVEVAVVRKREHLAAALAISTAATYPTRRTTAG